MAFRFNPYVYNTFNVRAYVATLTIWIGKPDIPKNYRSHMKRNTD
jgi:hypothetical protein